MRQHFEPGVAGEFGVYPEHVHLMTQMVPGELTVRRAVVRRISLPVED